jgi:hypothetical protein
MRVVIRTAQLRVYLPADRVGAFDPHQAPGRTVMRVTDEFVWQGSTADDAYSLEWEGVRYLCPRYTRLRMFEGLLAFRDDHPGSALASELAVRRASQELVKIRLRAPSARSYILTAPWHVPLRWFTCFDPGQRELYEGRYGASIRYRTLLSDAVPRVTRAIEILEEAGFDDDLIDEVIELERWLQDFAAVGMLELDYHSVAALFSGADLAFDESAAEVRRSLDALNRLDYEEAGLAYAEVAGRWAPTQALAYVN